MLRASSKPLSQAYDVAVLDLDGVVYVSKQAVPGAPEALNAAQAGGMQLAFVTNNAARPPSAVGDHLRELGIDAHDEDVVTSAQAAARLAASQLPAGARVFLVGGPGLDEALRERGLEPVTEPEEGLAAVVQGYGPDVPWRQVMQGARLVREGLPWVASNTDMTIPSDAGPLPGAGTLVELVASFSGREPQVAGKPQRPLFEETLTRVGGSRPLVVGDRLDTDIEGGVAMGWDTLLVLTGVSGLDEVVTAPAERRPTYIAPDLAALAETQPAPDVTEDEVSLGGWAARDQDGSLEIHGQGSVADWWRVLAVAAWRHLDDVGQPVDTAGLTVPG